MKFCKKCHKRIIEKVYTENEWENSCHCDKTVIIGATSELGGVLVKQLAKRNLLKEF